MKKQKNTVQNPSTEIQSDVLMCPMCGKEFKRTDQTFCVIENSYACSWKCFQDRVNHQKTLKEKEKYEI